MGQTSFTTIKIYTKPYIKHYLETSFGKPTKIPPSNFMGKYLSVLLSRPMKEDNLKCSVYQECIQVTLNITGFKRYGYGLTKTNNKNFNIAIEDHIRTQIRAIAQSIYDNNCSSENWKKAFDKLSKEYKALLKLNIDKLTLEQSKKLKALQKKINDRYEIITKSKITFNDALMIAAYDCMGFDEQSLPFETIRKDFYRYKIRQKP